MPTEISAQSIAKAPADWHLKDLEQDSLYGVSADRAYRELLKGKTPKRVRVAIIDSGFDTAHTDLKDRLWRNPREVAGNGKDDDGNGYTDDVVGWNFIGAADGRMVEHDTYEFTREYVRLTTRYATPEAVPPAELPYYRRIVEEFKWKKISTARQKADFDRIVELVTTSRAVMTQAVGAPLSAEKVAAHSPTSAEEKRAQMVVLRAMEIGFDSTRLAEGTKRYTDLLTYSLNEKFEPRGQVDDTPTDLSQRHYGNNNVGGGHQDHGTHVAGIVGALRGNNADARGVADAVELICIRAVPSGDERDKDVANAIRYATDQGAQIINMSFGKDFSPQKAVVDSAVRYAMSKGILIVHGAGNDGKNNDEHASYPNPRYAGGGEAEAWIEVGATNWEKDSAKRMASFTNYGKNTVDVFAPGVDILSLRDGGGSVENSGTSMAAPVVTGVAAVVWAYYPKLTAVQLRSILMESVTPMGNVKVEVPVDSDAKEKAAYQAEISGQKYKSPEPELAPLETLSRAPGIVNLYRALQLAERRSKR